MWTRGKRYLLPKDVYKMYIIWPSTLVIMSVPDEGYSRPLDQSSSQYFGTNMIYKIYLRLRYTAPK